ncbi:MAG: phosphoenolpyruvate carboxylase [Candidatus Bathyarchaeota archaeon]|nr:phosphoenolpyruvate carboxylase [Candidatus Bathyarchaeota archaeon]
MQKIPVAMATQHADSAARHVAVREEVDEAVLSLKKDGFNCDEVLVDYMGKLTPYHQIGQIVQKIHEKTDFTPGEDVFVTPRMVSSFIEEPFRQLMTTAAIIEGIKYCSDNFDVQGITEVIQAAVPTTEELRNCKVRCEDLLRLVGRHLKTKTEDMAIRIVPLFGGIAEHLSVEQLLTQFIKEAGVNEYARVFIGKSEAALLYGHLASSLSCKVAIAGCKKVEDKNDVKIYPVLGCGALPFRGHMTLENAESFLSEYRGVRTFTIQSGLRYDHGAEKTRALIEKMRKAVNSPPLEYDESQLQEMKRMIFVFAKNYLLELSEIAEKITPIAEYIPDQRERLLDFEAVAYYRELRNVKSILGLCRDKEVKKSITDYAYAAFQKPPRWVRFVAATYTCGLPPEFIGLGTALKEIEETMGVKAVGRLLDEIYPSLQADVKVASRFLDRNLDSNILLTPRLLKSIGELENFVELEEPDGGYLILSRLAASYVKDILAGKASKGKRLAILIDEGDVAEYLNGVSGENLSKMILDLGRIRKSLA